MELKKYKLGDVADIVNGATPSTHNSENYDGSIIWITPKDLSDQKQKIIRRGQRNISEIGFNNCSAQMIPPYNILMSSRAPIGLLAINKNECCTNQGFKNLVLDKSICDTDYMYYYLQFHMKEIEALGSGTTFKEISKSALQGLEIRLPNLEKQRDIAKCLSDLDRKIELNKQINDNLEAMAKQLYDYWFVQFDFPNEDGKPYKSSGGAMVWNEKLKREIPQGWSDCVLGDYIGRITNGLNPRKNFVLGSGNNYYVTIRSLVGTTIDWNNCDRCDDEALSKINSRSQLQIGDIIFSAIGTIGRTYYILEEPTNWNISETSFTLRAKENVPNDFFYGMLRSNEIQIKADKAAMGSTLRCLIMDSLCSLQYIKIPSYMMKLFSAKVSPLYRQIHRNNKEIAELTKQRDELLPLLMNGQASVNYHLSAY
ncbi:restriction endonuclease subunit S [Prevotella sp.]|uniref:restriction endonuclease subunit S n=1 Tax=Prevotella sp. TaxID=59823 RepID=UPI002E77C97E|nr:restriction endonuclease subunit S [Prevotella sp.]MEE0671049.1 restriction endonuclease subunit S [Prevotella sp.]